MMIHMYLRQKRAYWLIVFFVTVICYGFLLTNPSIGIDDENFPFYFEHYGIVSSGRYGYILLMKLLNTYVYLPVWRDLLAILLLVFAATLLVSFFQHISNNRLGESFAIIFACVIITFPLLAQMFVYISINIEVALVFLLASLATISSFEWMLSKRKRFLALSIVWLVLGISFIENCLNYYVTGVLLGLFIVFCFQNEKFDIVIGNEKKKILSICKTLMVFAGVAMISMVINSILARIMTMILQVPQGSYAQNFIVWNLHGIRTQITMFKEGLIVTFTTLFRDTFYFKVYILSVILFMILGIVKTIRLKSIVPLFLVLGTVLSTMLFYLITGNTNMVVRAFVVYSLFTGFSLAFIYEEMSHKLLKRVVAILIILIVFYQTKEVNQAFQEDYKRFLKDSNMAHNINREIEKSVGGIPNLPVVFLGSPLPYVDIDNRNNNVNLRSMFHDNENNNSLRIHPFFDMLGYQYRNPFDKEMTIFEVEQMNETEIVKQAKKEARSMPEWPAQGSIKATEEAIIVKLGPYEDEIVKEDRDIFFTSMHSDAPYEAQGNIAQCRITLEGERSVLYIRGSAYFETLSSTGTRIFVILSQGDEHHILWTKQEHHEGSEQMINGERLDKNLHGFYIYRDIPNLGDGTWELRLVLANGHFMEVIEEPHGVTEFKKISK